MEALAAPFLQQQQPVSSGSNHPLNTSFNYPAPSLLSHHGSVMARSFSVQAGASGGQRSAAAEEEDGRSKSSSSQPDEEGRSGVADEVDSDTNNE